ncbi:MAG: hypothetical protein CMP69_06295 [Flavobacteriales bacterium]|nr:hypothetical protein [Flavobacteriales bacterium]
MISKNKNLILLLFLLTGYMNNLSAYYSNLSQANDSSNATNNFNFNSEINKYASDSINIDLKNKNIYLYGNASITYENAKIQADQIIINWETNIIEARCGKDSLENLIGCPIFTENNETFNAKLIKYNLKTKKSFIKNISTKEGEGYILGKTVKKTNKDVFFLRKGDYTTCNLDKPHYSIRSNKIKVIPGEKIITGPAYLTFFNIPTPLILPFGYFPSNNKQSSGVLIPSYGESENLGFFLKNGGYYFTISEKLDLQLRGDVYSKGSWSLKSLLRYKNRYKYSGNVNLNYSKMVNSINGFPDYSKKNDFFIRWSHKQDPKLNPLVNFSANVNAGSSTFHRNNSINSDDYLSNTFQSSISITKRWNNLPFNLSTNLNHSQNTQTNIVNLSLPDISFSVNRIFPFKNTNKNWIKNIGLSYNMQTKNSISTLDTLLFKKQSLSKFRNGMKHNIPISTSIKLFNYFTLNPRINFTERWYLNQIEKKWNGNDIVTDTIKKLTRGYEYSFSTNLNTKIYGLIQFPKSKITAIRHVMSPNISFNYKPDFSSSKYDYYKNVQNNINGDVISYSIMENGIYGSPSKGRNGNIGFNLNNILEVKIKSSKDTLNNTKKIKILESLNISSSYNIFKDSLKFSNINLNARTRIFNIFDINFSSIYDPYVTNKSKTNNLNQFEIINNRLARLKSLNTSIGLSINDKSFTNDKREDNEGEKRDFYDIPWQFSSNYSLTYNKGLKSSEFSDTIQTLNFSGNLKITPKWKIGFRSGFDFKKKELSYTTVDIYRDLHCWEMLFNWIPLGFHRSYTITIRVKADILKDLKYEKRKDWFKPDYD